jgi:CubicO group peptidase (beta-lactamase class C family)
VTPIGRFLQEEAQRGSFPSAAALVGDPERVLESAFCGAAPDTLFDLASLTKVLATAALARLAEREGLDWERPIGTYLPDFKQTRFEEIRAWHLAAHVSGLPSWRPLYAEGFGPEAYRRALARLEPEARPGERVVYGDLGVLVLGEILEQVLAEPLDRAFAREVAEPAGSSARFGPIQPPDRAAPTESGNEYERELCLRMGLSFDRFRTEVIRGEVHDGNAYFRGGVAAHAGLFGTAVDVWKLVRPWFSSGERFLADWTPTDPESRGLLWQRRRGAGSAVPEFSEAAFGHTGFTGASAWADPGRRRVFVLLTNRIHPEVRPVDFHRVRRRFHEIAINFESDEIDAEGGSAE